MNGPRGADIMASQPETKVRKGKSISLSYIRTDAPTLTLMYIKAVLAAPPEAYMGIYRWDSQSRAEYPSIAVCIVEVRNYRA